MSNYFTRAMDAVRRELPNAEDDIVRLYALLTLTTGAATTMEHVHDAWSAWTVVRRPDHRSMIPFAELSPEVQEFDRKYMEVIHRVAAELAST